jgi:hypothetical protein
MLHIQVPSAAGTMTVNKVSERDLKTSATGSVNKFCVLSAVHFGNTQQLNQHMHFIS